MNEIAGRGMSTILWWTKQVILSLACCFFILFGVYLLVASYHLEDPFSFVMTFFASNLIILISAALLAGFLYRMITRGMRGDASERGDIGDSR